MDENTFGMIYDNFSNIYNGIEGIIKSIYSDLQNNPSDVEKSNYLQALGEVAVRTLNEQMNFVETNAKSYIKDDLLNNLDAKKQALIDALAIDRDRFR